MVKSSRPGDIHVPLKYVIKDVNSSLYRRIITLLKDIGNVLTILIGFTEIVKIEEN